MSVSTALHWGKQEDEEEEEQQQQQNKKGRSRISHSCIRRHSPWQPVSGTGHKFEKLGYGVEEVQHLRHKEQHHGFTEVGQNCHYCKCHASEVAECVTHKHLRRIPAIEKNTIPAK